ncbi:MAG: aminopeptidase P family protein [Acidimicrobiia bacterium]|nr:aminopeptidase P family protein [Acidimicrobiia bacterium]
MTMNLKITEQKRTGFFADCSREEFDRRIRRLREEMGCRGIDGLLLTQQTNVRYASAFYEVGWIVPAYFYMVFVPRKESLPLAIFCPEGDQIQTEASSIETVIRWDFPAGFYTGKVEDALIEATVAWFKKLDLERACMASEIGAHFRLGLSVECFDGIRKALPEVEWSDCGSIMWAVRCIKSEEEVRRLREACRISCLGIRAGFEAIRDGASERDIANCMSATMHASGGGEIRFLSFYAGQERALWADSIPRRDMIIRPGSLLQFDGGCTYEGYFADFKRFACLGEPTPEQRCCFEIAKASEQAAIDKVAPGITCGEVYEASQQAIRDAGYPAFVEWCQKIGWSSIGHNLGLDIHEMPGISINSQTPLQPNMVLAIEPFFYHKGGYPLWEVTNKYGLEDDVLVTATGHEVLTPDALIDRDIWIA